jgi:hypothetical protein
VQRHGPEHWKQRAHGLADARRRLGQQAAPVGRGPVDRLGQVALSGPKRFLRKRQFPQRLVASDSMPSFLPRPSQEGRTALREHVLQFLGTEDLPQLDLGLARDIEVHERQGDLGQAAGAGPG